MKKLMIVAAAAVMTAGVSAKDLCTVDAETSQCQAYDVSVKLKTLTPKTIKCKGGDACKGQTLDCVSYYKNGSRNLKGIIWNCQSECDLQNAKFVLWRTDKGFKNAIAMNDAYFGLTEDGKAYTAMDYTDVSAEAYRYEKKANKVTMVWALDTAEEAYWSKADDAWVKEIDDKEGNGPATLSVYNLWFAGLGSFDTKKGIIKNVSGGVAGSVTGDPTIKVCNYLYAGLVDLCADFEALCDDLVEGTGTENIAAYGTWKMKYSKKIAGGTKSIASYIPAFAK
jgi:hypothetical protein